MTRTPFRLLASALSAVVLAAVIATGPVRAEAQSAPTSVGVSDSGGLLWADDADLNTTLSMLTAAGIGSLRVSIPWSNVETAPNQFEWSAVDRVVDAVHSRGISMLGIIAYTPSWATSPQGQPINTRPASPADFGRFAGLAADRYAGKIDAYEIWNEPNGAMFYGPAPDAAGYTQLLRAAYPAIKTADASATVVGGVLGAVEDAPGMQNPVTFTEQMYANGAAGYFDAFSYHPYQYSLKFADGVYVDHSPARQAMDIHAVMTANGDGAKKIWATEYGAPTAYVSEAEQNEMITHFLTKWQELPYAGPIYLYQLRDQQTGSSNPEMTFGLMRTDWSAKPALWSVMNQIANGVPTSAEHDRFQAVPQQLGAALSPVFPVRNTWAQIREHAVVFEMPAGFIASPRPVADAVRPTGFLPTTGFNGTWQDFDSPFGLRAFSTDTYGTHLVGGGIVAAWDPTLGPATSGETPLPGGGVQVQFQYGSITWTSQAGATVTR